MKIELLEPVEYDIAFLSLTVAVWYGDEDMPYDFFGRDGDVWAVKINVETGQIEGWQGGAKSLDMEVVDCGTYCLIDKGGAVVASIENEYAPSACGIGGGDYIEMSWDENGFINDWPQSPDFSDIINRRD